MLHGSRRMGEPRRRGWTARGAWGGQSAAGRVSKLKPRPGSWEPASDWWWNASDSPSRGACPPGGNQTTGGSLPRPRERETTALVTTGIGPDLRSTAFRCPIHVGYECGGGARQGRCAAPSQREGHPSACQKARLYERRMWDGGGRLLFRRRAWMAPKWEGPTAEGTSDMLLVEGGSSFTEGTVRATADGRGHHGGGPSFSGMSDLRYGRRSRDPWEWPLGRQVSDPRSERRSQDHWS